MAPIGRTNAYLLASSALAAALIATAPHARAQDEAARVATEGETVAMDGADGFILLDAITIGATKLMERAVDALASVSVVDLEEIQRRNADTPGDLFATVPGVSASETGDDPASAINIRGLQNFGRVAVTLDGARQNFQRTGHNASGMFYIEPEMLKQVTVIRGPVANIYGSGAIGGVLNFETIDPDDIIRPGERHAAVGKVGIGSNGAGALTSVIGATRLTDEVSVLGNIVFRGTDDYEDGDGTIVPNSAEDTLSGLLKTVIRPADGHEIELSGLHYDSRYDQGGQINIDTTQSPPTREVSSVSDTHTVNSGATARYRYSRPEDRFFDVDASVYWTRTETDQTKTAYGDGAGPGEGFGEVGDRRSFAIDTTGFDINNSSRFDTGPVAHTLTYGVDAFADDVTTSGYATVYTPSGKRNVYGGFVQLRSEIDWIEVIGALRYDSYDLSDGTTESGGDRVSPKLTVGVTPVQGLQLYGTYAEGYRAPAITETLVSGIHPGAAAFSFIPNPDLRPEIGRTIEAGINLSRDGLFRPDDAFRAKAAVFRNDVTDYIENQTGCATDDFSPFPPFDGDPTDECFTFPTFAPNWVNWTSQYDNVADARLQGVELEANYDMGWMFLGLAGSIVRGDDRTDGGPLADIPGDKLAGTIGFRAFDRKLTFGGTLIATAAQDRVPADVATARPSEAYNLVNLFAYYEPHEDLRLGLNVDNLFDETYRPYLDANNGQGLTVKVSVTGRFGG